MYYVPTPSLAYDSVRYISTSSPFGSVLRGLHFWGASFIVVAVVVHMLRVFFHGSYKAPREVTWITGVRAAAADSRVRAQRLSAAVGSEGVLGDDGDDQHRARARRSSASRSRDVLRGGRDLGALTLGRWYTAHVFLLPAALVLVRRRAHRADAAARDLGSDHGAGRPARAVLSRGTRSRTRSIIAAVFASLLTLAIAVPGPPRRDRQPGGRGYIPRPEWYFLSLFQLLKYFPGAARTGRNPGHSGPRCRLSPRAAVSRSRRRPSSASTRAACRSRS